MYQDEPRCTRVYQNAGKVGLLSVKVGNNQAKVQADTWKKQTSLGKMAVRAKVYVLPFFQ
jgi:hypothetical protein